MIFVVLGTQKFQCNRLLKEIDDLVADGTIQEEVFAQRGCSDYEPLNYQYSDFLSTEEFEKHIAESTLLITHSGVGTILAALRQHKPVIVYPRLKKYKEHVDDHQLDIAHAFSKKNLVLMCGEKDNLAQIIQKSRDFSFETYVSQRENVLQTIRDYIQNEVIG